MTRTYARLGTLVLMAVVALASAARQADEPQFATGIVFHDANGNQLFDAGEQPLPDVRVSNGRDIVRTGADGRYRLPVGDDTIVFVIKPRGWRTPLSDHELPRFYYVHKPHGSPELKYGGVEPTGPLPASIDFPLYEQDEPDRFRAILFGDPQPRNQAEIDYIGHDVVAELVGTEASFGVTLGDIVFDDLSLFEPLAKTIALLGIPWYNVIGNHDINFDARHDRHSHETFERVFGPPYYSFDHGPVHFLVLDDVEWLVDESGKGRYRGGLGPEQMEFIRNDLALIPEDQLVVLMMHIPLVDVHDRHELYRLIEQRPFCISISGHTHTHEHRFITREDGWRGPEPHHHIINVTVSGSWWQGAPDERGIPHATMADGAPNGYSLITFDGRDYTLDFRAAGRAPEYQMQIHAPESVTAGQTGETDVLVNVFNGSERSEVAMRAGPGGEWLPMERTLAEDPTYRLSWEREKALGNKPWRDPPDPKKSTHLWRARLPDDLPPGTHLIEVRTTDMHGRTFSGRRVVRVDAGSTAPDRDRATAR
ncbi:MAG TPA: calcineurin-like phosphoesterase family protein [Planctomycetaceae bacterium]|nr:calcineurin-like phosphoesterase family protein [Planctomycetaceae bacterium]